MNFVVAIVLLISGGQQDANLYRYREAWTKATHQQTKDSIRNEVLHDIPVRRVNNEQGQEQVQLWDLCCSGWDVVELFGEGGKVDATSLPTFAVHSVDGITFFEAEGADSPTEDTTYTANNRLAGYGGIDIYLSPCHYYPVTGEHRWLAPYNIGRDINTAADEFGLQRKDSSFTFMRAVDGMVRKYRATERSIVREVDIHRTCAASNFVLLNIRDCRNYFTTSMAFDGTHNMVLPLTAKTLEFRCCGNTMSRTFPRCDVTVRTLVLRDTDIRTHICLHDGITTHADVDQEFGFSIYEDAASAEAAFHTVAQELLSVIGARSSIVISVVPGHLTSLVQDFTKQLSQRNVRYETRSATADRTTIVMQLH